MLLLHVRPAKDTASAMQHKLKATKKALRQELAKSADIQEVNADLKQQRTHLQQTLQVSAACTDSMA